MKKKLNDHDLQPEDLNLSKNIPENTDAKIFKPFVGYDVYVLGESVDSTGRSVGYWKNGVWNNLNISLGEHPKDFFVSDDGHLYIGGTSKQIDRPSGIPHYYLDNNRISLEAESDKLYNVSSLVVDDDVVYTCGTQYVQKRNPYTSGEQYYYDEAVGIIWKNNKILFRIPGVELKKIRVLNGVVYTAGITAEKDRLNVLYRNDTKWIDKTSVIGDSENNYDFNNDSYLISSNLTGEYQFGQTKNKLSLSGNSAYINSVSISPDNNVLIIGLVRVFKGKTLRKYLIYAGLWRDGKFDRLESRYESNLTYIQIIDNHEFISGNIYPYNTSKYPVEYYDANNKPGLPETDKSEALIWINGERYQLSGPHRYNKAFNVFVIKK